MRHISFSARVLIFALLLSFSIVGIGKRNQGETSPADEAALRQLVTDFIATYPNKDAVRHMLFWSEKSPQYAQQKQTIEQTFKRLDKIEAKNLAIRKVTVDGDGASVRFDVEMSPTDRNGRPLDGLILKLAKVYCVRENGQWKVQRLVNAITEFVDAILATRSSDEVAALLAKENTFTSFDIVNNVDNRGIRQYARGEYPEALRIYLIAEDIAERTSEKYGQAMVLNNMGIIYHYQGNYALALETYKHSLALAKELKKDDGVAHLTTNVGLIYHAQGNLPLALQYFQESLDRWQTLKNRREVAECLTNLGSVYRSMGDYPTALDYLNRALQIAEQLNSPGDAGSAYATIGEVYMAQGDYKSALDFAAKAKEKFAAIPDKAGLANALGEMGSIYNFENDPANALEFAGQSAAVAKEIGLREVQWNALVTMGNAYRAQGNDDKAKQAFDDAIAVIEDIRSQVAGNAEDVQRFFENKLSPYQRMIDLLAARQDNVEALRYAERAKGRVLLDILKSGRVNITKSMTAVEIEQEKQLNGQLATVNAQLERESLRAQPDQKQMADLTAKLQKARLDHEEFTTTLYSAHKDLKAQRGESQPIKMEDISALLPDSSSALLEYVVTERKSFLFVLTSENKSSPNLKVYTIPTKQDALAKLVNDYRDKLAKRDLGFRAAAGELYNLLVKPAQAQLKGKSRIVIVPDGVLWELPFQALTDNNNRYLIESAAVSYAPSISVLEEMEKVHRKRIESNSGADTLLAFGNPVLGDLTTSRVQAVSRDASLGELPDAEAEVKGIAQVYGAKQSKIYVRADARKDLFETEAGKYRIVHLATHGLLNNASPMYSQVVLAQGSDGKQDGLLEAWEIMNLNLNADMVVMSACETARGRVGAGEGVIGLSWALFVAGSPTTVVSQWKVDSASTSQLMQEFHKALNAHSQKTQTKAEALRSAALKVMQDKRFNNPFYWAGFVLIGDGN